MKVGEIIKSIRIQHDLTQEDLAEMCYRSRDWVSLIETGSHKTTVTKEDLIILSKELNEPILRTIAVGMAYEDIATCIKLE